MSEKTQITCNGLMPLETLRRLATSCKPLSQRLQGVSRRVNMSQGRGEFQTVSKRPKAPRLRQSTEDFRCFKYYFLSMFARRCSTVCCKGGSFVILDSTETRGCGAEGVPGADDSEDGDRRHIRGCTLRRLGKGHCRQAAEVLRSFAELWSRFGRSGAR
jgi:hypothetical protein